MDAPAELEAETLSTHGEAVGDLRLVVALEADDAPFKPARGASKTAPQTTMFKSEKTDLRKNVGAANKVRTPACFPAFLPSEWSLSNTRPSTLACRWHALPHSLGPLPGAALVSENTV